MFFTISHLNLVFMMVTELLPVGRGVNGVTPIDRYFLLFGLQNIRLILYRPITVRHLDGADRNGRRYITVLSRLGPVDRRLRKILVPFMYRPILSPYPVCLMAVRSMSRISFLADHLAELDRLLILFKQLVRESLTRTHGKFNPHPFAAPIAHLILTG